MAATAPCTGGVCSALRPSDAFSIGAIRVRMRERTRNACQRRGPLSWRERLPSESPGLRQIALRRKRLRSTGVDRVDVLGIRRLIGGALPISGQKRRLFRYVPSEFRERSLHESCVDRLSEILGGQRARDALLLVQPLEDRFVDLAPELCVRIDV